MGAAPVLMLRVNKQYNCITNSCFFRLNRLPLLSLTNFNGGTEGMITKTTSHEIYTKINTKPTLTQIVNRLSLQADNMIRFLSVTENVATVVNSK